MSPISMGAYQRVYAGLKIMHRPYSVLEHTHQTFAKPLEREVSYKYILSLIAYTL